MKNSFKSRLANELQDFLDFKRSLGLQYDSAEWMLRRFDRFVEQIFKGHRPIDLKVAIEGWLATFHCKPVTITNQFLVIRKFCLFLRRRDPCGFVPDRDLAPRAYESHYLPHIFSPAEIRILLGEIGKTRTIVIQNRTDDGELMSPYPLRIGSAGPAASPRKFSGTFQTAVITFKAA